MKNNKGFTLIEILVALTLFAILATITSFSMYHAFNTRDRVNFESDRLNSLQLAISIIKQDAEKIVIRPIRGDEFHLFPAFVGLSDYVELTRGGLPNLNGAEKRSSLQRVAFLCQNKQLIRRTWQALDSPKHEIFENKVLLTRLNDCHFAFLDTNLQLLNEWRSNNMPNASTVKMLPKAIQLNLTLPDWGKATFLFIIPEALYENV